MEKKRNQLKYVQPQMYVCGVNSESLLQSVSGQHVPGTVAPPVNSKPAFFESNMTKKRNCKKTIKLNYK